ncbi:MAG TPA: hypothetical protein VGY50_09635, partial [Streptosporangiaceae bacterium]|nr:hypothetical protein [Streptosporangiaceae bacterium]
PAVASSPNREYGYIFVESARTSHILDIPLHARADNETPQASREIRYALGLVERRSSVPAPG